MSLQDRIKGTVEKKPWYAGSQDGGISQFMGLDPNREESPEERYEQNQLWILSGLCPGCGHEVKRNPDGRLQCTNCPLVITAEVVEKYGDHWSKNSTMGGKSNVIEKICKEF